MRIEDTDAERNRPELIDAVLDQLTWLGLGWDGTPVHQSERVDLYRDAAAKLVRQRRGLLLRLHGRAGAAAGQGRGAASRATTASAATATSSPGPSRALRFRMPDERRHRLARPGPRRRRVRARQHRGLRRPAVQRHADVPARQRLRRRRHGHHPRHPGRGPRQRHAQVPADASTPSSCPSPSRSPTCRCSSTSSARSCPSGATTCRSPTTAAGASSPRPCVNYLALLGWGPRDGVEVRPIEEIVELYRLEDVSPSPAFFDQQKLLHVNAEHIRMLDAAESASSGPRRSSPAASRPARRSPRSRPRCATACARSARSSR